MKQINPQEAPKFHCNSCEYKTDNKKDYNKHCLTSKHLNKINGLKDETHTETTNETVVNPATYTCCNCNKTLNSRTTLWRHKKTCIEKQEATLTLNTPVDFVKQIVKNNEILIRQQIEIEKLTIIQSQEFQLQLFNKIMENLK